jgi:peptide-methionine (S)-S-oxide reductase
MNVLDTLFGRKKAAMISPEEALPGRNAPAFAIPQTHEVLGTPIQPPFPEAMEVAYFGMGCFWGAERLFWEIEGVYTTAAGYMGGYTSHPTYEEVCTSRTGHAEVVMVVYDPARVSYETLLKTFLEEHDPTQGMRQGADVGTQYRSGIWTTTEAQREIAQEMRKSYGPALDQAGYGEITTTIEEAGPFYYAEDYHQQYLHKHPNGYCGLDGTGVSCPVPWGTKATDMPANEQGDDLPQSEEEWKRRLTPEQYQVLRQAGTERAFTGKYVDTEDDGMYRCAACGNLLFDSETKFHSGSGWPSFTDAIPGSVTLHTDRSYGMVRTEVRCARCDSHLGHLFDDGPRDRGGQRWCMNSCALDLTPR